MIDFLSRYTRNIWTLCFRGYVDRVREILRERPELARQADSEGITPLWWLPDDEQKAMEIVELLIAAGADPAARSREGRTAADWARTRGMLDVARRLDAAAGTRAGGAATEADRDDEHPADLARFEMLAQDLLFAFESGNPESLRRLRRHFGGDISWGQLRAAVRQRLEQLGDATTEGIFRAAARAVPDRPAVRVRDLGRARRGAVGARRRPTSCSRRSSPSRRRRRDPRTCRSRCARHSRCGCATTRACRRPTCGEC